MIKFGMEKNVLEKNISVGVSENASNMDDTTSKTQDRVDINVLKSRIREVETKQFRRNLFAVVISLVIIGSIGIYVTYL